VGLGLRLSGTKMDVIFPNTCIRGLMLRLIFPLSCWQENSWSFAVDKRSLPFLRAADHHHITRCTARFRRGILGTTGKIVGGVYAAFRLVETPACNTAHLNRNQFHMWLCTIWVQ
jgi:hypothetical protein